MKASELIKELQTVIEEHGDLEVSFWDRKAQGDVIVSCVDAYDHQRFNVNYSGNKPVIFTVM